MIPVPKRDWTVYAVLAGISLLVRIPFLSSFDLVSYDGTYYINQARVFWSSAPQPGTFPIGYPLFISLLLPIVSDGVRAAQLVSFFASLGSLFVLYRLGLCFLDRRNAFYCAAFLAVTPVFVRLSMQTFSESLYTFFMLLTFWAYARGRDSKAGVTAGLAAITRPEMLGVAGILAALRYRTPQRALLLLLPFLVIFSFNALKFYQANGQFSLLPKSEFFGTGAQSWTERELTLDGTSPAPPGPDGVPAQALRPSAGDIAGNYLSKFPRELFLLARNVGIVMLLLAAFGMWHRPTFLLVLLAPLIIGPLFTVRSADRYLLPYVPVIILYGFVGAGYLKQTRLREHVWSVLGISLLLTIVMNTGHFTRPVDDGLTEAKTAGLYLKDYVSEGTKIADRKPYVAFYAGAEYVELPIDSYEDTLRYLTDNRISFLSLHLRVLKRLRPVISTLVTDPAVVAGELRYKQVWGHENGLVIYQRTGVEDPLRWKMVDNPGRAFDSSPDWSPDGNSIVFSSKVGNHLDIFMVPSVGGERRLVAGGPGQEDQPDWSADGRWIAFTSNRAGDWNVHVIDMASGDIQQVTRDPAHDSAPSWSPDGKEIFFVSDRSGKKEIWKIGLAGGVLTQLTSDGDNNFPSVSPDGTRLAWTRLNKGLFILDLATGDRIKAILPREVNYAAAWSPDGRYLAVSGRDWGSVDIYMITADGQDGLLLTKNAQAGPDVLFDAMPSWSPDGTRLALISTKDGPQSVYVLDGITGFLSRFDNPVRMITFDLDG